MKQYVRYPFRVCVNDQFDRFSAPIENRYTQAQVYGWLRARGADRSPGCAQLRMAGVGEETGSGVAS